MKLTIKNNLTKYGLLRKKYLKENRAGVYSGLLLSDKLTDHLLEVQTQAEDRMDLLIAQMKERQGVTEALKEENQMLWLQKMNAISHTAEEVVLREIIFN